MKQIVYLICVKNREQTGASSRSPHHMLAWLNGRAADLLAWCKSSIVGLSSKGMRAVLVASTSNQQVAGSTPVASSIVTPLGRINHSKTWEHLFYACGRTATHGRDSSVSEFDGRVRIPVTNQMARLLKCRGPGFYPNVNPPSFGMYILSHEEGSGWVCVWSKQTPKGKIRKLFIWWV